VTGLAILHFLEKCPHEYEGRDEVRVDHLGERLRRRRLDERHPKKSGVVDEDVGSRSQLSRDSLGRPIDALGISDVAGEWNGAGDLPRLILQHCLVPRQHHHPHSLLSQRCCNPGADAP
jgi:hypothetical protein